MQITPFLWFDNNAEEAVAYYRGIFPGFHLVDVMRSGPGGPGPEGDVITATFELAGQRFMALNGGPEFHFTEAVSFFVSVDTQQEVDELWSALTADGGQESQCGWLKDKFGVSWQIIPKTLMELMSSSDREAAGRVTQAMLAMRKIDTAELQRAYDAA